MSAVNDGRCSPWVMCSCSVVSGNQIRDRAPPPQRAASRRLTQSIIQEGGGAEVEPGGGPGPCGANETGAHQGRADKTAET